ncbi:MAG: ABC transporter ATP-binding protein [Phycisphaerales bacterium]|jgi:lipoprotein-releasing system ATP-binding protein|nr:ABC transporter ATP-binding protein [Phycisphaerales bacterium]
MVAQTNNSVNKSTDENTLKMSVRSVQKTYRLGRVRVPVLHGVDLDVKSGEWVTILGASGSGKSTLLHLMGGLDRPDKDSSNPASVKFEDRDLTKQSKRALDRYRADDIGFVFQFYHLLPELSVLQNVTVGSMIKHGRLGYGKHRAAAVERAESLLDRFGLSHRLKHRPAELSGGERQRVAIARALINEPSLLLADEPTGNLDLKTGESILEAMIEHRRSAGLTLVMVTHDERIAERADRVIRLVDGVVVEENGTIS